MINKESYKQKMIKLQSMIDKETSHADADALLCEILEELGYKEIVDEYYEIDKWYA